MIGLRHLRRDNNTGRRNSPHATSSTVSDAILGEDEPDTTRLVAGVNREPEREPDSTTADNTRTPPSLPADEPTPEPASGSADANSQDTSPRPRGVGSSLACLWRIKDFGLTRTVAALGFVLAVAVGAATWSGMNYANYYAKKSYELALYQTCRSYEVLFLFQSASSTSDM
jgi:hypothetical protein